MKHIAVCLISDTVVFIIAEQLLRIVVIEYTFYIFSAFVFVIMSLKKPYYVLF